MDETFDTPLPFEKQGILSWAAPSAITIRSFLSLPTAHEVASLAAALSPKCDESNPDELVEKALMLLLTSEKILQLKRQEILDGMLPYDVDRLKAHFGMPVSPFGGDDSHLQDPASTANLADPLKAALADYRPMVLSTDNHDLPIETRIDVQRKHVKSLVAKAGQNSGGQLPEYPYQMANALSIFAGIGNLQYSTLVLSFKDYLTVLPSYKSKETGKISRLERTIQGIDLTISDTTSTSEKNDLEKMRKDALRELDDSRTRLDIRKSHTPGKPIQEPVRSEVELRFNTYFPAEPLHNLKAMEGLLDGGFKDYITEHRKVYAKIDSNLAAVAKSAKKLAFKHGKLGIAKREREKWLNCTNLFVTSKEFPAVVEGLARADAQRNLQSLLIPYLEAYSVQPAKSGPSIENMREFFGSLINCAIHGKSVAAIRSALPKKGFKALTDASIAECYQILSERLGSPPTRTRKSRPAK